MIANQKDFDNFAAFLRVNNCYEKFCREIYHQRGISFKLAMIWANDRFYEVIDKSFIWDKTTNGQNYWTRLDGLWNNAYHNGINFITGCNSIW